MRKKNFEVIIFVLNNLHSNKKTNNKKHRIYTLEIFTVTMTMCCLLSTTLMISIIHRHGKIELKCSSTDLSVWELRNRSYLILVWIFLTLFHFKCFFFLSCFGFVVNRSLMYHTGIYDIHEFVIVKSKNDIFATSILTNV